MLCGVLFDDATSILLAQRGCDFHRFPTANDSISDNATRISSCPPPRSTKSIGQLLGESSIRGREGARATPGSDRGHPSRPFFVPMVSSVNSCIWYLQSRRYQDHAFCRMSAAAEERERPSYREELRETATEYMLKTTYKLVQSSAQAAHTTFGAKAATLPHPLLLTSWATTPSTRFPIGWPFLSTSTQALSSNLMVEPSFRLTGDAVRTITARLDSQERCPVCPEHPPAVHPNPVKRKSTNIQKVLFGWRKARARSQEPTMTMASHPAATARVRSEEEKQLDEPPLFPLPGTHVTSPFLTLAFPVLVAPAAFAAAVRAFFTTTTTSSPVVAHRRPLRTLMTSTAFAPELSMQAITLFRINILVVRRARNSQRSK